MIAKAATKLKTGDRVVWGNDDAQGTVREANDYAIKIEWDDGKWSLMPFADEKAPWVLLEKLTLDNK